MDTAAARVGSNRIALLTTRAAAGLIAICDPSDQWASALCACTASCLKWLAHCPRSDVHRDEDEDETEAPIGHERNREMRMAGLGVVFAPAGLLLLWQASQGVHIVLLGAIAFCEVMFWVKLVQTLYGELPQYVGLRQQPLEAEETGVPGGTPYCDKCEWSDELTLHCASCGVCFVLPDHHCGIVGTCIHQGNRRVFMQFLVASACGLGLLCVSILCSPQNHDLFERDAMGGTFWGVWEWVLQHNFPLHPGKFTNDMLWACFIRCTVCACSALGCFVDMFLLRQIRVAAFVHGVWWNMEICTPALLGGKKVKNGRGTIHISGIGSVALLLIGVATLAHAVFSSAIVAFYGSVACFTFILNISGALIRIHRFLMT